MMLGNFGIDKIEQELGIQFPEKLRDYMEDNRQEDVSRPIAYGKWHCFNLPFTLVLGGKKLFDFVVSQLSPLSSQCKTQISIAYTEVEPQPEIPE